MNYRHIYHAGNFADVFKHLVLMLLLEYLGRKEKPFFVLDTHAGIGLYDLGAEQAQKTGEAQAGIMKLAAAAKAGMVPDAVTRYLALVAGFNQGDTICKYPGSPLLIQALLRPNDRFVVNELHPEDNLALKTTFGRDKRGRVEQMDGYLALKSLLPPVERRGMALIDPPFEVRDEFERMMVGLREAHERWATGSYVFWYPVKDVRDVRAYHQALKLSGIGKIVTADFFLRPAREQDPEILNGCGLAIINPPWTLADDLNAFMPWVVWHLTDGRGVFEVKIVAGD